MKTETNRRENLSPISVFIFFFGENGIEIGKAGIGICGYMEIG